MLLVGLYGRVRLRLARGRINEVTYERQTAVRAVADLGLVDVDEDSGVTGGTTATIALDNSLLLPADGLSVDKLNGGQRLRLFMRISSVVSASTNRTMCIPNYHCPSATPPSKSGTRFNN